MTDVYSNYIRCPKCISDVGFSGEFVSCLSCGARYGVEEGIVKMLSDLSEDRKISIEKWDKGYQESLRDGLFEREFLSYKDRFFDDVYKNVSSEKTIDKSMTYLEIGCGPFLFGNLIADKVSMIIGIDFSLAALKVAKSLLDERGITNYLLIQSDILNIPLKNESVDLIYGGGVIEHFEDTQKCVNELFRILRDGGICLNTVPYLNIASLTYRQLWGNIPNVPVLKQIAEFVHIRLLKKRHMIFGYEMSFLGSTLKNIHRKAGFSRSIIGQFDIDLTFEFVPKFLKPAFVFLAKNSRLFWPMVKVVGVKGRSVVR